MSRRNRKSLRSLLAGIAILAAIAGITYRSGHLHALAMLGISLGVGALILLLFAAFRALTRPPEFPRIEPSFETSILAFPPESRLEPRGSRRS